MIFGDQTRLRINYFFVAMGVSLISTGKLSGQETTAKTVQTSGVDESIEKLSAAFGNKDKVRDFYAAMSALQSQLNSTDSDTKKKTAASILSLTAKLAGSPQAIMEIERIVGADGPVIGAERLLRMANSANLAKSRGMGKVVFGRIRLEDGKLDPEMVLAQMVIAADGWFVTEIRDASKPLSFRAEGYAPLDAKISEDPNLGTLVMKPIASADKASVVCTIRFEDAKSRESLSAKLSYSIPPSNSLTGGTSPRKKWPEPRPLERKPDGTYQFVGATPGDYLLMIQAPGHEELFRRISLLPGESKDLGEIALRSTDPGFYLNKPTPAVSGGIPWEKTIEAARTRARKEGKPMMIMATATWCGPCKILENETLSDPWVRQFLKEFVVVQAYEVEEINEKYDVTGYPTLIFTNSSGEAKHTAVGSMPPLTFSGNILRASQQLGLTIDPDLKKLAEMKVVKAPVPRGAP